MCAIYKFLCMFPNYFTSVMQYGGDQVEPLEQARNAFWDTYVDGPERAYSEYFLLWALSYHCDMCVSYCASLSEILSWRSFRI